MDPQCYFDFENPCFYRPMKPKSGSSAQNFTDNFEQAPDSPTELGKGYTQGYLKTIIGERVKLTFLLGTNITQDRDGILKEVGISYVVIQDTETKALILCDIYSIKFVTIYPKINP
jgi:hypothetical protein